MSRIGKKAITIPEAVSVEILPEKVIVKGKHGTLEQKILEGIDIQMQKNELIVTRQNDSKKMRSFHGLNRALLQNCVQGVNEKFSKILMVEGVGYKFQIEQQNLILSMGYSHPVKIQIPKEIEAKLESPTKITLSGIDKEKVGFLASKIREVRPPEPYKGKGIRYEGERIIRKAGKTGK